MYRDAVRIIYIYRYICNHMYVCMYVCIYIYMEGSRDSPYRGAFASKEGNPHRTQATHGQGP